MIFRDGCKDGGMPGGLVYEWIGRLLRCEPLKEMSRSSLMVRFCAYLQSGG
jgi:hypothetical protein